MASLCGGLGAWKKRQQLHAIVPHIVHIRDSREDKNILVLHLISKVHPLIAPDSNVHPTFPPTS